MNRKLTYRSFSVLVNSLTLIHIVLHNMLIFTWIYKGIHVTWILPWLLFGLTNYQWISQLWLYHTCVGFYCSYYSITNCSVISSHNCLQDKDKQRKYDFPMSFPDVLAAVTSNDGSKSLNLLCYCILIIF